jgi:hypothetical protein
VRGRRCVDGHLALLLIIRERFEHQSEGWYYPRCCAAQETIVATRVKPTTKDLYEDDWYAWAHDQAALLRAGRFDALDLEHLIEEVEDLAGSLRSAVRSRATTVMAHLLKLQHSPAPAPRLAWRETVRTQRTRLLNDLTPSLRPHLAERLAELYSRARHDADGSLRDRGENAAAEALPTTCPYTLDQITGDWLP